MPHFQTSITRQLFGDNVFFKVLNVFFKVLLKKNHCPQGVLKATFDASALTRKIGQYKLRLA